MGCKLRPSQILQPMYAGSGAICKEGSLSIGWSRSITAETALRLAAYFSNDAQFWMNLQTQYDLEIAQEKLGNAIKNEVDAA